MAMGSQTGDILLFTLWRGVRAILLGLPLGLFFAWILSRILSSFLFQLNPNDALAWILSSTLLIGIVVISAFIPVLRMIRVNPIDALRNE
jgi:putative ABC transport system permease protein